MECNTHRPCMCVGVCVCVCMCMCVRACLHACVHQPIHPPTHKHTCNLTQLFLGRHHPLQWRTTMGASSVLWKWSSTAWVHNTVVTHILFNCQQRHCISCYLSRIKTTQRESNVKWRKYIFCCFVFKRIILQLSRGSSCLYIYLSRLLISSFSINKRWAMLLNGGVGVDDGWFKQPHLAEFDSGAGWGCLNQQSATHTPTLKKNKMSCCPTNSRKKECIFNKVKKKMNDFFVDRISTTPPLSSYHWKV